MRPIHVAALCAVAAFSVFETRAQSGWYPQTSGTTLNLSAVSFSDVNTGTAVGWYLGSPPYNWSERVILRTTDGGATWTHQLSGQGTPLRAISFTDANTGTVVGDGEILRTTDGGATWFTQLSQANVYLGGVWFVGVDTGTAVGVSTDSLGNTTGLILRTTNGGENWVPQSSGTTAQLNDVCFMDANTGYAVGGFGSMMSSWGVILRTTDGGTSWRDSIFGEGPFGWNPIFSALSFTDATTGTVVGNGGIIRTTDGGETWTKQLIGRQLQDVSFSDASTGRAVGWYLDENLAVVGEILSTTDAGATWTTQLSGVPGALLGVSLTDPNTGTAVGEDGTILRTTTGGFPASRLVTVRAGWNLVSLPLRLTSCMCDSVFPTSISGAFVFNPQGGYCSTDPLVNGVGFWIKFPADSSILLTGEPVTCDTIELSTGWNLVGSISEWVWTPNITQDPPGILYDNEFYQYNGTYSSTNNLFPGYGYWVRAREPGRLILSSVVARQARPSNGPGGQGRQ
jgi:photosystem II stability/assembly factor-like uncharacterized protein